MIVVLSHCTKDSTKEKNHRLCSFYLNSKKIILLMFNLQFINKSGKLEIISTDIEQNNISPKI